MKTQKQELALLKDYLKLQPDVADFEVNAHQLASWQEFVSRQPGINPLLLPDWAGALLLSDGQTKNAFKSLQGLSEEEKLFLFFSAQGHDPALIVESIPGLSAAEYWLVLEKAQKGIQQKFPGISDVDLLELKNKLYAIVEGWHEFAEEWETRQGKKQTKTKSITLTAVTGVILLLLYIFTWPFIFPLDGEQFFQDQLPVLLEQLNKQDEADPVKAELLPLVEEEDWETAFAVLEDELMLTASENPVFLAWHLALLVQSGQMKEARRLSGEYQPLLTPELADLFSQLPWKTRFQP